MDKYREPLDWIATQKKTMLHQLEQWAAINSGSDNIEGLDRMRAALRNAFLPLGGTIEELTLPPKILVDVDGNPVEKHVGKALRIIKKRKGTLRLFLGGHMDTVYPKASPFQTTTLHGDGRLQGPGVADMKGGLVVLLTALQAVERSGFAEKISWEVVINADEETGSCSSAPLFVEAAHRNDLGMIFEPSFDDGAIVSARKGSLNFAVVSRGKGAHAGRDFHAGRSAIPPLARFIVKAETINDKERGITLNFGRIEGGIATNIVPDLAICRCNARMVDPIELDEIKGRVEGIIQEENARGAELVLHYETERAPKVFDAAQERLFLKLKTAAADLGIALAWRPSGGVCDGNILVAEGLPTIDTLGVVGGKIHTVDEYMHIDSLVERAQLSALFIMNILEQNDDLLER